MSAPVADAVAIAPMSTTNNPVVVTIFFIVFAIVAVYLVGRFLRDRKK